jgi:hypothetical protein
MDVATVEQLAREMRDNRPPEDPEAPLKYAAIKDLLGVFVELWPEGGQG